MSITRMLKAKYVMARSAVFRLLDGERDYQVSKWGEDESEWHKSPAEFVLYMEHHLAKAREATTHGDDISAMEQIRKVTALGVAAMELNGCAARSGFPGDVFYTEAEARDIYSNAVIS